MSAKSKKSQSSNPTKQARAKQAAKKSTNTRKNMSRSQAAEARAALDAEFRGIRPSIQAVHTAQTVVSPQTIETSIHDLAQIMGGL